MKPKNWKDWFYFSKNERSAFALIAIVLALFIIVPFVYHSTPSTARKKAFTLKNTALAHDNAEAITIPERQSTMKPFDPNTANPELLRQLGLTERNIQTILHYREKGGRFLTPTDILKIYGIKKELGNALIPYVHIENIQPRHATSGGNTPIQEHKSLHPIDINNANIIEWASLPGIGEKLSVRIVNYRTARKGFSSINDLKKVYGLPEETFNTLKPYLQISNPKQRNALTPQPTPIATTTKKININTASEAEFATQGKIPKNIAKAIIIYREQNGNYKNITEIKNIAFINDEIYNRLKPYITTEE